jgi:hypothetical protein
MGIITSVSGWWLPICLLAGVGYAFLLYYRQKNKFSASWLQLPLAALRATTVALLSLLLLNPYLRFEKKITELPLVVVAVDNSSSMLHQTDSASLANQISDLCKKLENNLKNGYDLRFVNFGRELNDGMPLSFNEPATNLSKLFQTITNRYAGLQLSGIVLMSDGIFNQGSSPLPLAEKIGVPVYAVAFGDTTLQRDLLLRDARANQVVFINNDFNVLVDIEANRLLGNRVRVVLEEVQGTQIRIVTSEIVDIDRERYFKTMSFVANAGKAGILRYRVKVELISGTDEISDNNSRELFVEVIDARTRVLLLAHGAHPDLSTIRTALESSPQYQVDVQLAWQSPRLEHNYDLAIVHQLPSIATNSSAWLQILSKQKLPTWYIVGSQTQLPAFNQQQSLLAISSRSGGTNKTQAAYQPMFRLFNLDDVLREALPALPPLDAPFGEYRSSAALSPLLLQRIGSVNTDMPLWALSAGTEPRTAILAGEGLWRWQLAQAEMQKATDVTGDLIRKTAQFLTVRSDKRPFKVRTNRKIYQEQDDILFEAELYNKSFEAVNEPEVNLTLTEAAGTVYNYVLGRLKDSYYLNAGGLPAGNYTYTAQTSLAGENYQANGAFAVSALVLEKASSQANHDLLTSLAILTGGSMFPADAAEALSTAIQSHELMKPVTHFKQQLRELISFEVFLALLGLLLGIEWVVRRYAGNY